jgi:inositol hexakisphosphate/diphosphoinositol-pentakisphosphate kinase
MHKDDILYVDKEIDF